VGEDRRQTAAACFIRFLEAGGPYLGGNCVPIQKNFGKNLDFSKISLEKCKKKGYNKVE
jgi:hypothetical protein